MFINPEWDGGNVDDKVRGRERLVLPRDGECRWWSEVFGRADAEMNPAPTATITAGSQLGSHARNGDSRAAEHAQDVPSSVLTGVETADQAMGAVPPMKSMTGPHGGVGGNANVKIDGGKGGMGAQLAAGMKGLGIGNGGAKGPDLRAKSPGRLEKKVEMEMQ